MEKGIDFKKIDKGIKRAVKVLRMHGFETFKFYEGSLGHPFYEPTIKFYGDEFDLIRAWEICELYGLRVFEVKRVYWKTPIYDKSLKEKGSSWDKPFNEIIFKTKK